MKSILFLQLPRIILIILLFAINPLISLAKSYHVAITGIDTGIGTLAFPYRTIQKAATVMLAGDTCYIHAGTYYETVRPASTGTVGKPMVFTRYQNDSVVVHGGKVISGWTQFNGNIYKAQVSEVVKDLFVNRQYMILARHPNMPYDPVKGFDMCRPTLGTANPPAGVDWTGVTVVQNTYPGQAWCNSFTKSNSFVLFPSDIANGGWLMGVPGLIDSEREWCWKAGVLYLYAPGGQNPENLLVEGKIRDCAFDLSSKNYVNIENITIFGASVNMRSSTYCILDKCKILYVSSIYDAATMHISASDDASPVSTAVLAGKGVLVGGSYNTIQNCEIAYSWGNVVTVAGSHNTIYNNHIHDAAYAVFASAGLILINGGGNVIKRNTCHNTTAGGIIVYNKFDYTLYEANLIQLNEIYDFGLAKTDNGGFYCFMTDGNGTEISYNWIHDGFAGFQTTDIHMTTGIYLDDYSKNFLVHHNVIWNQMTGTWASGIRLNNPKPPAEVNNAYAANSHQIYNNTMYNCRKAINEPEHDWTSPEVRYYWSNTKVFNNILLMSETFGPAITGNNYPRTTPLFVDAANHNFQLKAGSLCIDAGKIIPGITDGYIGSAPDIGAYEYGKEAWVPGCIWDSIPTSISEKKMDPRLKVYPNPARDELFIGLDQSADKVHTVKLYSIMGKLVMTESVDAGMKQHRLDLRSFKSGIYILQMLSASQSYAAKVIIKK
jgi:hypothetical protein